MSRRTHTLRTTISFSLSHGDEHEADLVLTYRFIPGYPDSFDDPGEPDGAEILMARILKQGDGTELEMPAWLLALVEADADLMARLAEEGRANEAAEREEAEQQQWEEDRLSA